MTDTEGTKMKETSHTQSDLQEETAFNKRWARNVPNDKLPCNEPILKYQLEEFKAGWKAALASQAEQVRAAETRSRIDAENANSVVKQLAEAKEQVRKLEALIALDDSMRDDYVKMGDQIKELESEVDQLKQGRTNAGDETSGNGTSVATEKQLALQASITMKKEILTANYLQVGERRYSITEHLDEQGGVIWAEVKGFLVDKIISLESTIASQAEQVKKLEDFIALDDSMRDDYVKMGDQIKELESEVDRLKQGRTNSGDETSGTVARFGIDGTKIPLELIPATNGAFVWYSDYLKLYKQLAQSNETIKGLEAAASFWQEKCGKISEENVALRARIDSVDKQETVGTICHSELTGYSFKENANYKYILSGGYKVYTRPPITSERELDLLRQLAAYSCNQAILADQHKERELELLAVIEQKDVALQKIYNGNHEDSVAAIAAIALALTPDLSALKEHYVAEKSENGLEWKFANTLHDLPVGTKLYAVKP